MPCRYVCRYSPDHLIALQKVVRFLEDKHLDRRSCASRDHFLWGTVDRCKLGSSCGKTIKAHTDFSRLTSTADTLLSRYLESDDISDYHQLLQLLRGYFPAVYSKVEIIIRKRES